MRRDLEVDRIPAIAALCNDGRAPWQHLGPARTLQAPPFAFQVPHSEAQVASLQLPSRTHDSPSPNVDIPSSDPWNSEVGTRSSEGHNPALRVRNSIPRVRPVRSSSPDLAPGSSSPRSIEGRTRAAIGCAWKQTDRSDAENSARLPENNRQLCVVAGTLG